MNRSNHDKDERKLPSNNLNSAGSEKQQKHELGMSSRHPANLQTKRPKTGGEGSSPAHVHYWNPAQMGDSRIRGVEPIRSTYFDTPCDDDFVN